jgi:hypothetical protein
MRTTFSGPKTGEAPLALNPKPALGLTSATNPVLLPKTKPWAMREHFVVPSIGSRDVACAEWPDIRRFEHFLQLLNLVNDAFNVHSVPISSMSTTKVKRYGIHAFPHQRTILNHFRQISPWDQQGKARVAQCASMITDMNSGSQGLPFGHKGNVPPAPVGH